MPQDSGGGRDAWAVGAAYEPYIGRWSRAVAAEFVGRLGALPGERWLDVGCGTGAVARAALDGGGAGEVVGVDSSEGFVRHARRLVSAPRAHFVVGDAMALPVPDGVAGAVVSGLTLNFVPDPARAVSEMVRAARPGSVVGAYVWDYAEGMQLIRRFWEAAAALDERAGDLDEGKRFPLCRPGPLRALFAGAGLSAVDVAAIDVPTRFRDFDDYWTPFLGGQGPAPGYASAQPEDRRARLRERLRSSLPTADDGSIPLTARAWMVLGRSPVRP
ncbi:class I SAM-dependent methyltransferase [Streptomyces sp. NPDC005409]|uniref:class I SAM-dependent methyltransferase n=1 Tax=Streptomyces sp. NPDC005409 TaxID=3155342 RepID=UPI0034514D18